MSAHMMTSNAKSKLLPYKITITAIIKEKERDIELTVSSLKVPSTAAIRNDTRNLTLKGKSFKYYL